MLVVLLLLLRAALDTDLAFLLLLLADVLDLLFRDLDDEALDLVDPLLPLLLPLLPPRRAMIYSSLSRLDIHSTTER